MHWIILWDLEILLRFPIIFLDSGIVQVHEIHSHRKEGPVVNAMFVSALSVEVTKSSVA